MSVRIEWNRRWSWKILKLLYGLEAPEELRDDDVGPSGEPCGGGALLRLAWALSAMNEALPQELLEDLSTLPWPRDWPHGISSR